MDKYYRFLEYFDYDIETILKYFNLEDVDLIAALDDTGRLDVDEYLLEVLYDEEED